MNKLLILNSITEKSFRINENTQKKRIFFGFNNYEIKRKKKVFLKLQFFAETDDRTEKATPKKREETRKKGQVLQSREINSTLVLLFVFIAVKIFGANAYKQAFLYLQYVLSNFHNTENINQKSEVIRVYSQAMYELFKIVGPILLVAVIVGTAASYAQVGNLFTLEPLKPKFSKLNPINGLKRMFSSQGIVELLKSLFKILIVGGVAYFTLIGEVNNILKLMDLTVPVISSYIVDTALNTAIKICLAMLIIAAFDFAYQWWKYEKDLRMSKKEIKEEFKQTEGNPEIKSKIRQKQREVSMRRMLSEVPSADVVITNPTHFAVAIKYDSQKSAAPIVTAKGQDFMALRIKEIAKENKVQIVENKPLAQAIYKSVDINETIPPELYQAVAEILAFVYSLKRDIGG